MIRHVSGRLPSAVIAGTLWAIALAGPALALDSGARWSRPDTFVSRLEMLAVLQTFNAELLSNPSATPTTVTLTPASGSNKYGRNGLLAHTYMLRGGRAESNGCVVFKDYHRFLAAYKTGKIKRLVVVPRLTRSPTQVAQEGRQG